MFNCMQSMVRSFCLYTLLTKQTNIFLCYLFIYILIAYLLIFQAISLLDKLYDTFFTAPRKAHVNLFSKHFIKIEFLDKYGLIILQIVINVITNIFKTCPFRFRLCRPVFKEFDEWPQISLEPDPPKEKKEKKETPENLAYAILSNNNNTQMYVPFDHAKTVN